MTATISLQSGSSASLQSSYTHSNSSRIGLYQALSSVVGLLLIAGLRLPHLLGLPHEAALRALNAADAIAVFAVIAPTASALASLVLPRLLGARGLAFPRLSQLAFTFHLAGMALVISAYAVDTTAEGGSRWLLLSAPSSQLQGAWVSCILAAVLALGASHSLAAVNVLTSVGATRTGDRDWSRLPLLAWALYARALMHAIAGPALVAFALVALAERALSIGLLDAATGGDPLLALHLFWVGFHPLLASALIVSLAVSLETIRATASDQPATTTERFMVLGFAATSVLAWGQHMVATPMGTEAAMVFCALGMLSLVPLVRLVIDAVRSLSAGETRFDAALVFALGSVLLVAGQVALGVAATSLGVSNGLDAVLFGRVGLDLLTGSTALGLVTALLRWWPALTERQLSEARALGAAGLLCAGVGLHFSVAIADGVMPSSTVAKAADLVSAALLLAGVVELAYVLVSSLRPETQRQPIA